MVMIPDLFQRLISNKENTEAALSHTQYTSVGNPVLPFNHLKVINHLDVLLLLVKVHSFKILKNEKTDIVRFIASNFKAVA